MSSGKPSGGGPLFRIRKRLSTFGSYTQPPKQESSSQSNEIAHSNGADKTEAKATTPESENVNRAHKAQSGEGANVSNQFAVPKGIDYSNEARTLTAKPGLRDLYPPIDPFKTGMLAVDDNHKLYWEVCGNEKGAPVVFLHGGPGSGCSPSDRRFFDPKQYCIYIFDQRGAGRSTPHAELENNTTWDLVEDIEKLRKHVGVEKWHIFGGSWGSCLCLAYAQKHPDSVRSMVLRGIFTLRRSELLFFYQDGSSHLFPEQFEPYREYIPKEERKDMMSAYYKRLTGVDEGTRLEAAKHWSTWENATSKLFIDHEHVRKAQEDDKWALAFARIEAHYFVHGGWFEDGQLLQTANIDKIRHIPAEIVQGRYDVVCPATTAYELHRKWPEANFHLVPDNGHSSREIGIQHCLLEATDKMLRN